MEDNKKDQILIDNILNVIKNIYDPEIPVNIYELGLIYDVKIENKLKNKYIINIIMTLTSPNCPVAESLPEEIKDKIMELDNIKNVKISITFDPPWNSDMMSENAKLELGII